MAYACGEWTIWDLTYKWGVVINNIEPRKRFDGIAFSPVFGPDSRRVAYVAAGRPTSPGVFSKFAVIVDGKIKEIYDSIFSNVIFDAPESFHYISLKDRNIYLVEEKIR